MNEYMLKPVTLKRAKEIIRSMNPNMKKYYYVSIKPIRGFYNAYFHVKNGYRKYILRLKEDDVSVFINTCTENGFIFDKKE